LPQQPILFSKLQYATGLQAKVIGKPSKAFFMSAVEEMGVAAENVSHGILYE